MRLTKPLQQLELDGGTMGSFVSRPEIGLHKKVNLWTTNFDRQILTSTKQLKSSGVPRPRTANIQMLQYAVVVFNCTIRTILIDPPAHQRFVQGACH